MKHPEIDNTVLLSPISELEPCGSDLEFDISYDTIKNLRKLPHDNLPEGVWERPPVKVNWEEIYLLTSNFLRDKSKNLQIAVWRAESLYQIYGFVGFVRGVELVVALCKKFWTNVYPLGESDDFTIRMRPIKLLLSFTINYIKTFDSKSKSQYNDSDLVESPILILNNLLLELKKFLDEHAPDSSPSFSECFDTIALLINKISDNDNSNKTPLSLIETESTIIASNRDKLYSDLSHIADKLYALEPHSPVPFILREICQWKVSSFEDLLKRLPKDGGSIYDLYKLFSKK